MAWVNDIALIILGNLGVKIFKDYDRQKKEHKEPVFDVDAMHLADVCETWKSDAPEIK